jgi:hypothetical protein
MLYAVVLFSECSEYCYAESRSADCFMLSFFMLIGVMLSIFMLIVSTLNVFVLIVFMLSVFMLSVFM